MTTQAVLLVLTALVIMLQLATGIGLFYLVLGDSPGAVAAFYRGDSEQFIAPKTLPGLLKTTLPHLVAMTVVGLFLLHLLSCTKRCKGAVAALFFTGMLLDLGGGYLTMLHPLFVWFKMGGLVLLMAGAFAASGILIKTATRTPGMD